MILKEQIIREVWEEANVTDEVLSNSIWQLRKALGDDARNPRFIQTVPKRGYRLIAPVSWDGVEPCQPIEADEANPGLTPFSEQESTAGRGISRRLGAGIVLGTMIVTLLLAGIAVWILKKPPSPRRIRRLTVSLPPTDRLNLQGRLALVLSPDGEHLVYRANQQLYLRAMDELAATPMRGTEGSENPFFSPDGQWVGFWAGGELFYRGAGERLMVVPYQTDPTFTAGNAEVLFEEPYYAGGTASPGRTYDISLDGQRFLMIKESEEVTRVPVSITVVLNWLEELKRLVPTDK